MDGTDMETGLDLESETGMALIGVIAQRPETALELETALSGSGHRVVHVQTDREGVAAAGDVPELFVVDLDEGPGEALAMVRRLSEEPGSATAPVLVAGSPEQAKVLADACAYGATGYLRKPFSTVETVPDTEKALFAAQG